MITANTITVSHKLDPRYVINEKLIRREESLLDISGNLTIEPITVKQLSLYDKYTHEVSIVLEIFNESGPYKEDSQYALLFYYRDELNKAHQEYLGEIYAYIYDLDAVELQKIPFVNSK